MSPPRIDAHQHFWKYTPEEYGWINDSMASLRRNFLPEDLQREIQHANIGGVVCVQARQMLQETQWLLDLASAHDFIRGVVGWVPLTDPNVADILQQLSKSGKLKGVRHVLQSEPDERYLLRHDFNHGIRQLNDFRLTYDILVFEHHLPYVVEFVERHPDQIFVLDHIAKPRIRDGILAPWQENIQNLAKSQNVYCKLSGMVTEAAPGNWNEQDFQPYFDTVFSAFGPRRLLFGSDWPVCLSETTYEGWMSIIQRHIGSLTESEQQAIMGGTAARVYHLVP
jgi:L-fucono-1,5-lactonase